MCSRFCWKKELKGLRKICWSYRAFPNPHKEHSTPDGSFHTVVSRVVRCSTVPHRCKQWIKEEICLSFTISSPVTKQWACAFTHCWHIYAICYPGVCINHFLCETQIFAEVGCYVYSTTASRELRVQPLSASCCDSLVFILYSILHDSRQLPHLSSCCLHTYLLLLGSTAC